MRVHFSTDDLPPRDREEFWLDVVAKQVMKLTPTDRPDPATFRAQFDANVVGRFTLFEYATSHRAGARTTADVTNDGVQNIQLRRVPCTYLSAIALTRSRYEELRFTPNDFCVISCEWPTRSSTPDGYALSGLSIPREVLSPLLAGGRLTRPVPIPGASALGSLLGAAFDAAVTHAPLLAPELGDAVLQNLCGLVALACGASEEGRSSGQDSLRAARLEAAKRHIEQHLAEPGLTPASAAAALAISVRHLHLLFEPTGTSFAQYVAQRRLLQCRAALASPTGASRSVADIAFGWGFNSLATFYRAFEREFRLPPTAVRNMARAGHAD